MSWSSVTPFTIVYYIPDIDLCIDMANILSNTRYYIKSARISNIFYCYSNKYLLLLLYRLLTLSKNMKQLSFEYI